MPFRGSWISVAEVRHAARRLRKQPVVTITTVLALAVGIGMASTGFTLLDAVMFSRLPYPNGDRFVVVEARTDPEAERASIDADRFRFLAERAAAFEHLGAVGGSELNLALPSGDVAPVKGALITPDSIAAFPTAPVLGRMLDASDGGPGAPPVALIRESLWRRHFSADRGVIGTVATISGVRRTIVGVLPDSFEFPNSGEIWIPLVDSGPTASARRSAMTFGVLRAGQNPAAAEAQVSALSKQFEAEFPAAPKLRLGVLRFTDAISRGLAILNGIMVTALVLVLLVISANVANLVLARTISRARELAVSTALGASRRRLVGQIFCEVLVLGAVAAALGLAASQATLRWLSHTVNEMPFWVNFTASPRTLLFVVAVTLLSAAVGGILPALKATRRDMGAMLAAGSRGSSTKFGWASGVMVATQVALSVALLNGALLMARGVAGYMNPVLPVRATEVLTARLWAENAPVDALVDAVRALPEVTAAGASTSLPGLSPEIMVTEVESANGEPAVAPRPAPLVGVRSRFFETLGASAVAGRLFTTTDYAAGAPPVAIVNEPFVKKFFGGRNPIGRRIRTVERGGNADVPAWREVVGVVPELGLSAGDETLAAGYYVPMRSGEPFYVVLKTSGDARRLASQLRATLASVDPTIQIPEVLPLQDVGKEDRAVFAGIGGALAALGGMALLLSVIGTYAILSLSVTNRTREIGIRTALGATRVQVLRTLMGRTALPPALGAVAGIALAQGLVAARGIFAFRLPESSGPFALPALGTVMIAAGLVAAWVPARRALRIEAAEALRAE
jgi:predicted permease